jgi:hypothetical protein
MVQELIIDQIKSLISKAIKRFSKELSVSPFDIQLYIVPCFVDDGFYPALKLLNKGVFVRNLQWIDLANVIERITYAGMGFDINTDLPIWIKKFMLKSEKDSEIDVKDSSYVIILVNDELKAFMYVNGQQHKEISIDYILETT